MDSKSYCVALVVLCVLSTANAFNITNILSTYEGFSTFNDLLTRTGLSREINSRRTITVLVVNNKAANGLAGAPLDVAKRVLSAHVVLDYFDTLKLSKIQTKSTIVTTLYQATGIADDMQGFLNMSRSENGVVFGSAVKGATVESSLIGSVLSQPYNVSVLQVSKVIQIPGIDYVEPPQPEAPKAAPSPAAVVEPSEAPAPEAEDSSEGASDAPSEAPGPMVAFAPAGLSPAPAPAPDADSLIADGEAAPAPSFKVSGSSKSTVCAVAVLLLGLVASGVGF